jgi:spore maturation protein CgeB
MKIMLVYPGATWSPYDVACGYEDALTELGHEVFPYPYHSYYAMFRQLFELWESRGKPLGGPARALAGMWASRMVVPEAIDFGPDVALVVMGISFHIRAFHALHALSIPAAILLTESPYTDVMQAGMAVRSLSKLVFTNDLSSVKELSAIIEKNSEIDHPAPVVYLPHSYNPAQHRILNLDPPARRPFTSDVFFHGTMWEERRALLEDLPKRWRLRKHNVHVSGARFSPEHDTMITGALVDNREMVHWYNCTKIAINHHRGEMYGGGQAEEMGVHPHSLGPRAFEISACGAFQLTDDRPERVSVFGDTVAIYQDKRDLIDKILYYLSHENEREDMARAAHERVQPCSFLHRAREIVVPAIERYLL